MLKWSAYPLIRVSICLILGIILADYFTFLWDYFLTVIAGFAFLTLVFWLYFRHHITYSVLVFGFVAYLGGTLAVLHDNSRWGDHYSNYTEPEAFSGVIASDPSGTERYYRYLFELERVFHEDALHPTTGKIYLYVKKGDSAAVYEPGDQLVIGGTYYAIDPPKNPKSFDYKSYLKRKNIYAQAFVRSEDVQYTGHRPVNTLQQWAREVRDYSQTQLNTFISIERERSIFSALLLGIKDHLDNEVKKNYASAGAMHVLAVSGLHVGIIYFMLLIVLKPLKDRKLGKYLFALIALMVVWMYALITGFSPSVMRAATMFSVIIISEAINRRANIYNSLGIAAFILVCINPFIIYEVGFQLSFVAVIGIVSLYPVFYRWIDAPNKVLDYIWSISCVSLAAQIATLPFSLYYFQQFPTYFLLANLLIIPMAAILLGGGIFLVIFGGIIPVIGELLGWALTEILWWINEGIFALQHLPYTVIDRFYLEKYDVVLLYAFIILCYLGLSKYRFKSLVLAAFALILFFAMDIIRQVNIRSQEQVVVYAIRDATVIDFIIGSHLEVYVDGNKEKLAGSMEYQVDPYRVFAGLEVPDASHSSVQVSACQVGDMIFWDGLRILRWTQKNYVRVQKPLQADILYLSALPKTDFQQFQVSQIILGAELNGYERETVLRKMEKSGIPVHDLHSDGYWELDLKTRIL